MPAYSVSILYFLDATVPRAALEKDGLLVIGPDARGWQVVQALGPQVTPLLARRTAQAGSLDELLFSMRVLGDDRLVGKTAISQAGS